MSIEDTIRKRGHDAYFGVDAGMQASPFMDMIMKLFKSLLSGICPVAVAHAQVNGNHRQQERARRRAGWEASSMTDDPEEVEKLVDCCMTVGQQTSLEEAKEFAAS